jgi:signal transduction histidine kinase
MGLAAEADVDVTDILRRTHAEDVGELKAAFKQALARGGEHALQFRITLPDGGTHWILMRGTVDLRVNGEPEFVRGVLRDMTSQVLAEEEISELRQKLAHASRVTMLGQLASALAHELSQPLSAIQHNVETAQILLGRNPIDMSMLREIIDDVLRDDRRAADVLQRLRTWLKQGRINMEVVRLHELAQDVVTLVRADATTKHVAIDCAVPRTLPAVRADRVHVSQVLLNLIINAIEAVTADARPQRRVSIEARVGADGCCEVSVSDTGPGIPADQLDRIFEPFVTAKPNGMGGERRARRDVPFHRAAADLRSCRGGRAGSTRLSRCARAPTAQSPTCTGRRRRKRLRGPRSPSSAVPSCDEPSRSTRARDSCPAGPATCC